MRTARPLLALFALLVGASVVVIALVGPFTDRPAPDRRGGFAGAVLRGDGPPPPTEIAQTEEDQEELKRGREEWIETMHRSPGVDWRRIESETRRELSLRRFGLVQDGQRSDDWTEIGSANLAGRTMAAAPTPDGQTLYVASNLGGVWMGTSAGENWNAIGDALGVAPHSLLYVPAGANPQRQPEAVFLLGSVTSYGSIHATTDGGATWFVPPGLPDDVYDARRILHDEGSPRTVYFLCKGRQWNGTGWDVGFILSRSSNGGQSFEYRYLFPTTPNCDMWMDRQSGGDIYVLSGATLHRSTDAGQSFQVVGSIPEGSISDVILAGSEAGAPTLFAEAKVGGSWKLYRSTDAGASWTYRSTNPLWWRTFNVSISDADVVYYGDVHCMRSADGGATFTKVNDWTEYYGDPANKLHADLPGVNIFWIGGQEVVYINTDGGTYVSYDHGLTVQNLSLWGLGVSQYYDIFTSATDPYLVAAGAQDQGFQVSLEDDGDHFLPFEQLISGDYGHLTSTNRDHDWLYCVYPGFILGQRNEEPPQDLFQVGFPPSGSWMWLPPVVSDPLDDSVFYFCADHLWRYERTYGQFHNKTEMPHDFGSAVTGLAISAADYNTWYAATNGGGLWYSRDAGQTWTETDHGPNPHYFYGTALVASPNDRDLAYAGGSGYLGEPVWKTTDGGLNWEGMSEVLPNTLVFGLVLGGDDMDQLFAATEAGPYGFNNDTAEWEYLGGTEAPLTPYWCVEWVPEIQSVRFGTYGRGIWDYRIPTSAVVADATMDPRGLLEVRPNPARDRLSLRFELARAGAVSIQLFDVTGRRVASLAERTFPEGSHEVTTDLRGRGFGAGVYFVRLAGPGGVEVRKVQIVEG